MKNGKLSGATRLYKETYASWSAMKQRCDCRKDKSFRIYGARGISYCERWRSFFNFLEDLGPRPKDHVLDRIDNNKGYLKENCRWVTRQISQVNRRIRGTPTSRFKGVRKSGNRWVATSTLGGKIKYVGIFCTEIEAALAHNQATILVYGEHAVLNEFTFEDFA